MFAEPHLGWLQAERASSPARAAMRGATMTASSATRRPPARLRLGEHDFVMKPGEAAEFDTRTPHWFGCPGPEPAEVLVLFGPQGEHIHVRARPRNRR